MRPSLALKTACLLAAALFLAPGCSGIKNEFQDRNLYRIGPISISGQRVVSGQVPRILVKRFDIAPEFESNAFVFLISQDQFREDFYNQFMVAPARMITHSVKEAFLASGLFMAR
mgnify:FL=1